MALTQRLDLRQSQTLVMTPQLQQAIKLLQLSNLELSDYVDQELERNPLLERDDGDSPDPEPRETYEDTPESALSTDRIGADRLTGSDTMAGSDGPLDTDYENVWTSAGTADAAAEAGPDAGVPWIGKGGGFDDGDYDFQQTLSERPNLRDHLQAQAREELPSPADRLIAAHLIDLIDDSGYLRAELDVVAEQLGCSFGKVETVLAALQKLDPPGVAARSLPECLALQLAEKNRLDPAMAALLDNLDMLAARDYAALIRLCGVDREDLADMIAEIRALDPKPGQAFDGEVAQIVTPDILMRPKADGGWVVELNADNLPRVLINQRYYSEIAAGARTKADKDYLTDCFASANWLVKSLHQRATTILKVATEIVSQQGLFFARGVQCLKPLILRDIADAIGMHESTVSRVTTNKFIATPRGLFELKYFFTSSIQGANGADAHSAEAVRFRIKSLIDTETAKTVLSDDRIVELLHGDGIDIARRTVAKYREGMKIPSSVQRRREKGIRL